MLCGLIQLTTHTGMARRGAQVDAVGNAADAGELGGDLLRHELAAEAGLRAFRYRV